jgi:hypothetical protein
MLLDKVYVAVWQLVFSFSGQICNNLTVCSEWVCKINDNRVGFTSVSSLVSTNYVFRINKYVEGVMQLLCCIDQNDCLSFYCHHIES